MQFIKKRSKCYLYATVHLNINSIFNKFEHILNILDSEKLDIISLNEVKLDENVPNKLYEHPAYTLKRRARNIHGGGIMIYIRKCYKIIQFNASADFEILSFNLKINNIVSNFVYGYRPPIVSNEAFLDHLDSTIKNMNLNNHNSLISFLHKGQLLFP